LAERTGLEPATPGVTGRYSNQLNYRSKFRFLSFLWWVLRGSNSRPTPCKGAALPTELSTQKTYQRLSQLLNEAVFYKLVYRFRKGLLKLIWKINPPGRIPAQWPA
jgi:hypothetical protein